MSKIQETKCTCKGCGKVWYYGKQEYKKSKDGEALNASYDLMCCTGCLPALFIPRKQTIDHDKCPNCGSKAVVKEEVVHDI